MNKLKDRAKKLKTDIPAVFLALKDKRTPWYAKILAAVIVVYALSPIDLIPDFIPVAGFADDIAALTACLHTVKANITPVVRKKAAQKLYDWFVDIDYSKVEEYDEEVHSLHRQLF